MDWLTDATTGNDIQDIIDALTAGGIVALCLVPTLVLVVVVAIIYRIAKRKKAKRIQEEESKHNGVNEQCTTNKSKSNEIKSSVRIDSDIQDIQIADSRKKRVTGLGMTSRQLHSELNYQTVNSKLLDNIDEPEHTMNLSLEFDEKGRSINK